jgi:hypothetical protein
MRRQNLVTVRAVAFQSGTYDPPTRGVNQPGEITL